MGKTNINIAEIANQIMDIERKIHNHTMSEEDGFSALTSLIKDKKLSLYDLVEIDDYILNHFQ